MQPLPAVSLFLKSKKTKSMGFLDVHFVMGSVSKCNAANRDTVTSLSRSFTALLSTETIVSVSFIIAIHSRKLDNLLGFTKVD